MPIVPDVKDISEANYEASVGCVCRLMEQKLSFLEKGSSKCERVSTTLPRFQRRISRLTRYA